ncbi:MAG TPA: SRPBCC domain-containing protein [Puia sp.]|nr:SRPBCC domain-containing protein [Puia sp.]
MREKKELEIIRVYDAPRELVFKVWTNPKHLAEWWGPHGFTNPVCEIDARPGGAILIHMKGPDGIVYPMDGTYQEISAPERLVFISAALDDSGNRLFEILNTVTFAEQGGKTKLTLKASVSKITTDAWKYLDGMDQGWSQSLERLGEYVQKVKVDKTPQKNLDTSDRELVISRLLDAHVDLVWKVWTEPDHIKNWWGPNGFTNTIDIMEVRPDGVWEFVMHGPDGTNYKNKSIFQEIVRNEKIIFEHVSGPKFKVTVTFAAHRKKTLLTWRMLFDSAEELNKVIKVFKADEGLIQNVDRLQAYLVTQLHSQTV